MPMQIEVQLFATLREGRFRQRLLDVPLGSTVADVCQQLALGDREAAILMVNGAAARGDHPLASGDQVALFPALGGG
jgi:sulfur-carrier protein